MIHCDEKINLEAKLDGSPDHYLRVVLSSTPSKPNMKVNIINITNKNHNSILNIVEIVTEFINYEHISEGYVEALQKVDDRFDGSLITKFKFLNTSLKEVHQKDIKPYPELQILELDKNNIEVIEGDLFDENPKLINVSLQDNRIWFIHVNAGTKLTSIPSLRSFLLLKNDCINKDYNHPFTKTNGQDINEIFKVCFLNHNAKLFQSLSKDTGVGSRNDYRSEIDSKLRNFDLEITNYC